LEKREVRGRLDVLKIKQACAVARLGGLEARGWASLEVR